MSSDFSSVQFVKKTRTAKKCSWCAQQIAIGSRLAKFACRWEGDFSTSRMHMECYHAMQAADTEDGWLPFEYGRGRTDDDKDAPPEFDAEGNNLIEAK